MTDNQLLEVILDEVRNCRQEIKENRVEFQSFKDSQFERMTLCRKEVDSEVNKLKVNIVKIIAITTSGGIVGGVVSKILSIF